MMLTSFPHNKKIEAVVQSLRESVTTSDPALLPLVRRLEVEIQGERVRELQQRSILLQNALKTKGKLSEQSIKGSIGVPLHKSRDSLCERGKGGPELRKISEPKKISKSTDGLVGGVNSGWKFF